MSQWIQNVLGLGDQYWIVYVVAGFVLGYLLGGVKAMHIALMDDKDE